LVLALCVAVVAAGTPRRAGGQWRAETLPGARFGPPLRAGLALGAVYGNRVSFAQFAGPIVLAEAGLGGGRVSAGYLLAFPFASGVQLLGSAIRTWGSPSQIAPNQTLTGGELRIAFFSVNVGLGIFRPVQSTEAARRTRYYMNVGFGI
jgi:hypothetical protein